MKRQHLQKIFSCFLVFCLMLSFSISSLATAFTGAYMTTETDPVTGQVTTVIKDVNPSGQTFSGQNVIEMNAYNNAPTLTNNTFNGSTDINPDFTNITSSSNAYNGSVDINYDGLGGTLDSNGDRFQSTTVTAESSDISISNGTFNGTTNINAQSVSLGSISQMDTLNNSINYLVAYIINIKDVLFTTQEIYNPSGNTQALTISSTFNGVTVSTPLPQVAYTYYSFSDNTLTENVRRYRCGYWRSINIAFTNTINNIYTLQRAFIYNFQQWTNTFLAEQTYKLYSYSANGEFYSFSSYNTTSSFREAVLNRFDCIIQLLNWYCNHFFNWYYPLDNTLPEYWRYYNTDTAQSEEIGLAGLMYNISWYLGQMYVLQSASESLDNFTDQVEAVTETFEEAEQEEQEIIDSISTGIESFNPDLSELTTFSALGWCSNYLQLVFLRLGTYGTVILIGLLLGVCMQFIGYYRYK